MSTPLNLSAGVRSRKAGFGCAELRFASVPHFVRQRAVKNGPVTRNQEPVTF